MFYKVIGRLAWRILKLIAPPLARKAQKRLTGEDPDRRSRVRRLLRR